MILQESDAKINDEYNFPEHVAEIRKINKCTRVIKSASAKKAIPVSSSAPPLLYGLPKVHKVDSPMRSIVSSVCSPMYRLAKFLDK